VLAGIMDIDGGSSLAVGAGDTGLLFSASSDDIRPFNVTTGSSRDAAIDLGTSSRRFKDLYLSGGVVFDVAGGTGTSTSGVLDDYEEGTFTPTYASSNGGHSITYDTQYGHYTKIGNRCIFNLSLGTDAVSGGSGYIQIYGFPFTAATGIGSQGVIISLSYSFATTITGGSTAAFVGGQSRADLYKQDNSANVWSWSTMATGANSNRLWMMGSYLTTG
jgi:hypothetical protein